MDEAGVVRSARPIMYETAWIISGPRLVQIRVVLSEAVDVYRKLSATMYLC